MSGETTYSPATAILELDERFRAGVEAAEFPAHKLRWRNQRWAEAVGLGGLSDAEWVERFGKFAPLDGSLEQPQALAYHGDQFGVYNPDIGDGRGFLFGQLRDGDGRLLDLGTKGSGQTPWSRTGDGRLTLKGGVREVLAANLLEALGVYTSKPFSVIETGEHLHRGDEPSPTRSAVLVRLSHSHIRFGTFQRLAYMEDNDALAELVGYCVRHYHPQAERSDTSGTRAALFGEIVVCTARLAASWMAAGFVHGVLNTDNMVVTGESFDYGPWRFLPTYEPDFVAAYFDEGGRYRYRQQPAAALWNLARLGAALAPISDVARLQDELGRFEAAYAEAYRAGLFAQLGLKPHSAESDDALIGSLLGWMGATQAPWSQVFFDWFCGAESVERASASPVAELYERDEFAPVRAALVDREPDRPARLEAAYFAGRRPATLTIDEVEAIWAPIAERDDWSAFASANEAIDKARKALNISLK